MEKKIDGELDGLYLKDNTSSHYSGFWILVSLNLLSAANGNSVNVTQFEVKVYICNFPSWKVQQENYPQDIARKLSPHRVHVYLESLRSREPGLWE